MCGIVGFFSQHFSEEDRFASLERMTYSLAHRGPDDSGIWVDHQSGIALGHRRLSILDLSPLGHQPMFSRTERYGVVYNGEIYNFRDVRKTLEERGSSFRSESDTEVLLEAFEVYGITAALPYLNGMFALAVWDRKERSLTLVRDRFGVKPLYYSVLPWGIAFGSELKPFLALKAFPLEINRDALSLLMQHGYISAPHSIFQKIWKLPSGTALTLTEDSFRSFSPFPDASEVIHPKRFWDAAEIANSSSANPFEGNFQEAQDTLLDLLRDAVSLRMISDVPLGAFLSGGVDSSLVVALMQEQSRHPVKTFSIGFHEKQFNEASFAKEVAAHLHTDHTELYVTPEEAQSVIPMLSQFFDEPFGDSSAIPTYLVSKLARQSVTVSLSGDGGDEFFSGYERYRWAEDLWRYLNMIPSSARTVLGGVFRFVGKSTFENSSYSSFGVLQDRLLKLGSILPVCQREELANRLVSFWDESNRLVIGSQRVSTFHALKMPNLGFLESLMVTDVMTYLTDDILTKVDRASMAVSLEAREPLLDYRLLEFAMRLPRKMRVQGDTGKIILRQLLKRYLPHGLVDRPKMGFAIPVGQWLRGPLRTWGEDLLSYEKLQREGYLNADMVRMEWKKHLSGKKDRSFLLWSVLMFQSWKEHFGIENV